jgi:hypothetical protein
MLEYNQITNQNSYKPSKELCNFLDERLQIEIKHAKKKAAGESNLMSRRKNYYLNQYVFPSMANLIVFLEYASRKELRKVFDKDVKQLLLGESALHGKDIRDKSKSKSEKYRRAIFRRFIHAALAHTVERKDDDKDQAYHNILKEDYENIKSDDFKYLLAEMAQTEIMWMMFGATESMFGSDNVVNDLMKPDMRRSMTWLNLLARGVSRESKKFDASNRPVLF